MFELWLGWGKSSRKRGGVQPVGGRFDSGAAADTLHFVRVVLPITKVSRLSQPHCTTSTLAAFQQQQQQQQHRAWRIRYAAIRSPTRVLALQPLAALRRSTAIVNCSTQAAAARDKLSVSGCGPLHVGGGRMAMQTDGDAGATGRRPVQRPTLSWQETCCKMLVSCRVLYWAEPSTRPLHERSAAAAAHRHLFPCPAIHHVGTVV